MHQALFYNITHPKNPVRIVTGILSDLAIFDRFDMKSNVSAMNRNE